MLQCSRKEAAAGTAASGHPATGARHAMDTQHVTPITQTATATGQDGPATHASDLNAFMFAGQALIDGCQAIHAEMLAFWQSRLKDGLATGQRLLECGSPQGALEIQLDYTKAALQAYLDQSTKVTGLLTHALTDSLMPKAAGQTPRGPTGALAA
jgi:Phasin protein